MWIFPGGTAITIPVPYNFGVFYGMGVLISDMMHHDMTPSEAIAATIANVWDSFNPLGQGDLGQTFTPTFARALVDIIKNKNYAGLPIKPADMPWDEWKPESEKYFKGVSTPSKWIAQKVNAAFGGGPYKKSGNMTDISPEILDYLAKSYTGGVGDFIMKSLSVGTNVAHGKIPELRQIPLETFVRKPIESADKGRFYATLNELQGINAEYQNLLENDPKTAAEFKAKNQNQLTAYNISSYKRGQLTNYNTMIKNAEKKGDKKRVEELNQKVISTIKEWEKGMDKYGIKNPTK
jgi:hypothetical protein